MNRWGIPDWLEQEVKARDKTCVYCGVQMFEQMPPRGPRKAVATWEDIINDASIVTRENIARCCAACNSSKGTKDLSDWIQSSYCKKHGINKDTVAEVARKALEMAQEAFNEAGGSLCHRGPNSWYDRFLGRGRDTFLGVAESGSWRSAIACVCISERRSSRVIICHHGCTGQQPMMVGNRRWRQRFISRTIEPNQKDDRRQSGSHYGGLG